MNETDGQQELPQKQVTTDAEILNKVFAYIKLLRSKIDTQLDILHISTGLRVILLVLLVLNVYILSFFTGLMWIVAFLLPIVILPFFLYGQFIIPGVMLLNLIMSALFIMRYRHHKIIFFFSCAVFIISLTVLIPAIQSLTTYFAIINTFK